VKQGKIMPYIYNKKHTNFSFISFKKNVTCHTTNWFSLQNIGSFKHCRLISYRTQYLFTME